MKGFILAAGGGTRLYPLTLEIPKPLLPVGKIPIITYLIDLYLKNGVDDIKINIQRAHLEDFYKWKATYFPRDKIELVIEPKPSGTFTPIVKKVSQKWFSEPIVVSNGDELKELNLKEMVDWHQQKKALVTVGLVKVKNPQVYGVAKMNGDQIVEFIEKPKKPPSSYINSGLYIMNPEIRKYFPQNAKFAMVETDLFPQLAKEGKLFGYKWEGKWQDVGTFERWEEAIKNWNKK
ncbi:MAG: nucleotidyltransferase family protein [Candidatus Nealsonbacteria bacterium]|nr:MAG: nucleotidyltransferase family protein [Candidatus Nealsonbacteria bacterium]